jgi:hypothetical protein
MSLKHTDFMLHIAKHLKAELPAPWQDYHLGETRWMCQVYYGDEKRIHYEVSRLWNRQGRILEIGLHFESRDSQLNQGYLHWMDQHLIELQAALPYEVKAEVWDKGWTKVYTLLPDQDLTRAFAQQMTQALAQFIQVVQPIYELSPRHA